METTTAEPHEVLGVLTHQVPVQPAHLIVWFVERYVCTLGLEILAIEVHDEVMNAWRVVVNTMMLRCSRLVVAVGRHVHVA